MRFIHSMLVLFAASSLGCSIAVSDLGSFREDAEACPPGGPPQQARDLQFELIGLSAHTNDLFEVDVIQRAEGQLASRIIYDALGQGTQTIRVPNAIPAGEHFVDFYGDLDQNGFYSPIAEGGGDHTWSRPIPLCNDGTVRFEHLAVFELLNGARAIGPDLRVTVANIPIPQRGGSLEMRVIADFEVGESQTVGVYRRTRIEMGRPVPLQDTEILVIPEILDVGTPHRIGFFFDLNRDGIEDPGSNELVCVTTATPTAFAEPLELTIDVAMARLRGECDANELPDPDVRP